MLECQKVKVIVTSQNTVLDVKYNMLHTCTDMHVKCNLTGWHTAAFW